MEEKTVYSEFVRTLKKQILHSRFQAARIANKELLLLYFIVGKKLSTQIVAEKWGAKVIENISADLQKELPGLRGFSYRNLMNMKQFAENYLTLPFLQLPTAEMQIAEKQPIIKPSVFYGLGFTHHMKLLSRCPDLIERVFYMEQSVLNSWTVEMLDFQIDARLFHNKDLLANNFTDTLPEKLHEKALHSFKDEYLLDFINVETEDEREVEKGIINNIKRFILTMGKGFAFIGNQHRVLVDGDDYFIDLLFYNRILKCLVAFDLKKGKFKPEYLGKMNFYLNVLNEKERMPDENPSIGILLVRKKNDTIVEFAFRGMDNPMGVATYKLSKDLPDHLKNILPDAASLKKLLDESEE